MWRWLCCAWPCVYQSTHPSSLATPRPPAPRLIVMLSAAPLTCICFTAPLLYPHLQHGYRGIWLKVPASRAHFVGHAVDRGFEFHHAEKVGQAAACVWIGMCMHS